MPRNFIPVANKVCDKSIGFHFANGKIHDTNGDKDKKGTAWRAVREPAKKGALGKVSIDIDADLQTIKWKFDGQMFAESVLTNYLKQKSFVAFISMFNKGDSVIIKEIEVSDK